VECTELFQIVIKKGEHYNKNAGKLTYRISFTQQHSYFIFIYRAAYRYAEYSYSQSPTNLLKVVFIYRANKYKFKNNSSIHFNRLIGKSFKINNRY